MWQLLTILGVDIICTSKYILIHWRCDMNLLLIILAAVIGFCAGYLTCLWWGKPARELRKLMIGAREQVKKAEEGMRYWVGGAHYSQVKK
jgi:hypothetical protein